ncbi:male sterility protein-domain-containing protein [Vararia minispora EC-137]|uniref:Male sterility protein-domain-containing protein n=1 Tax=Vararia minispora EC-137 TaxID=1314806 RepID=A0ACB8QVR0_9AGAM|nr:male sterility protein-domain-containing protein [Vararia minispora EC-137]
MDEDLDHLHADILNLPDLSFRTVVIPAQPPPTNVGRDGVAWAARFLDNTRWTDYQLAAESELAAVYLHTSGSTGHPKPMPWLHRAIVVSAIAQGKDFVPGMADTVYSVFPVFHVSGIRLQFIFRILGAGGVFVCLDYWKAPGVDAVLRNLQILQHRNFEAAIAPSMLEEIADSACATSIASLRIPRNIIWGGAVLRDDAGYFLVSHGVNLFSWGGITELGLLSRTHYAYRDPADWQYMAFVDSFRYTFIPIEDEPGRFSLVVSPGEISPALINHENPCGFLTPDAWMMHPDPSKPYYFRAVGRTDAVTVLSNGEKTNNAQLETLLEASPLVSRAVIFGTGRFLNGAIIAPSPPLPFDSDEAVSAYLDLVWPHIDGHVNRLAPQHSRLLRPLVLVMRNAKPFPYSDKGTVKSAAAIALYREEIDNAYKDLESGRGAVLVDVAFPTDQRDEVGIRAFVNALIRDALGKDIPMDVDLFRAGLDSLLATKLRISASAALRQSGHRSDLPRNAVYANPTGLSFARYLCHFVDTRRNGAGLATSGEGDPLPGIERMIARYVQDLPQHMPAMLPCGTVYAVTGTTGSLGSAFLARLLEQPQTRCVYLLNRRRSTLSMLDRHRMSFAERGLDWPALEHALACGRVVFLEIDIGEPRFGLDDQIYAKLTSEVTHIVHNAWLVNSHFMLSSFEPHVAGVRSIIDLALHSCLPTPPHITFISSIGVVAHWPFPELPAPEGPVDSPQYGFGQGYAHAKYVGEHIIRCAVGMRPSLRATIVRCGQIAGALGTGAWPRSEYIPRLFRASQELGMVPNGLDDVRWLPVNVAAEVLHRLVKVSSSAHRPLSFYNLENGAAAPWSRVLDAILSSAIANAKRPIRVVAPDVWLDSVRGNLESPAFPVLDYLEKYMISTHRHSVPVMSLERTREVVGELIDHHVSEEWLVACVEYACAGSKRS